MVKRVLVAVALLVTVGTAWAQEEKMTPEQQQQLFQQQMQMMTPMFGQMMKAMMQAQIEVLANPETADKLATYSRNYYNALMKKGFTKEGALRIAMAVGFPAFPAMQR
jgi:hypothetical protein